MASTEKNLRFLIREHIRSINEDVSGNFGDQLTNKRLSEEIDKTFSWLLDSLLDSIYGGKFPINSNILVPQDFILGSDSIEEYLIIPKGSKIFDITTIPVKQKNKKSGSISNYTFKEIPVGEAITYLVDANAETGNLAAAINEEFRGEDPIAAGKRFQNTMETTKKSAISNEIKSTYDFINQKILSNLEKDPSGLSVSTNKNMLVGIYNNDYLFIPAGTLIQDPENIDFNSKSVDGNISSRSDEMGALTIPDAYYFIYSTNKDLGSPLNIENYESLARRAQKLINSFKIAQAEKISQGSSIS